MSLDNNTWICHVCKERRPDELISVHSFALKYLECGERNVKYCNDKPECAKGALELEKQLNGEITTKWQK